MSAEARNQPDESGTQSLEELLGRVGERDESALAELYDRTCARVHGLCVRIVGAPEVAEEVTLDVYHRAWLAAHRFDSSRAGALSWILTMARNRSIDWLRSRAQVVRRATVPIQAADTVEDPRPGPDEHASLDERAAQVRSALDTLSREQRESLELAYFGGLSHREIALRLGEPLGTIKTRIRLGLGHLARTLGPLKEEP